MPRYVVLTHEDIDHVAGNQLFPGAEIITHRAVAERMKAVADPEESEKLTNAVHHVLSRTVLRAAHPGLLAAAKQLDANYDFEGIELVLPTTVFDERHVLDLGGEEVHVIHFGAAHQAGDAVVHVPSEGVLFAGDLLFNRSTPMGWVGSYQTFSDVLDRLIALEPETIVPGHGPVCGVEALREEQAYFRYVYDESKKAFDAGLNAKEAAEQIDLGAYEQWTAPVTRLLINVERAYREFRSEPTDAPWELPKVFDAGYHLAKSRGLPIEF
jgi:cyclase